MTPWITTLKGSAALWTAAGAEQGWGGGPVGVSRGTSHAGSGVLDWDTGSQRDSRQSGS